MRSRTRHVAFLAAAAAILACEHTATAPVADTAPGSAQTPLVNAPLFNGSGIAGLLITPTGLDFGEVQTGTTAPNQIVTITNATGAAILLNGVGGGPGGEFNAAQNCQGVSLAAGASCQMFMSFIPTTAGAANAASIGSWNGQSFNIALRGQGVDPRFRISSTALDFGDVLVGDVVQQSIDFVNIGHAPVTFSGAGGGAGVFGGSQNCQGQTLAIGQKCQFFYTFGPTAAGVVSGSTNGTANGQPFSFTFTGNGITPSFRFSATALDFGQVQVGTSLQLPITITNTSRDKVVINAAGGGAGVFGGAQNCQGQTLAVGGSCQFFYTFTPTAPGVVTGSTNGSINGESFAFSFTGTGIASGSQPTTFYRIAETALDFGEVAVGASAQMSIDFVNITSSPIVFNGAGGGAGVFGGAQNCQGQTLAPGASCQFFYTFSPTAAGVVTGSTNGTANGQPFSFTFQGTGVGPSFRISPTSIDFGRVQVGASLQLPITITNVGLTPQVINGAGGGAGVFGGAQNCQGQTLAVGASCQFFYTFSPTAPGVVTGSTNGSINGQAFSFSFTGNGFAPLILVTPFALDFGDVNVGTTAPQQTVNVINTGNDPVTMSGTGGGAGVFGGAQDCQGSVLAAGSGCHIFYAFTPAGPGPVAGSTNGTWTNVPFALTFTGNGVSPVSEQTMDLSPATISLAGTVTTSAVLLSSSTFDATTVTLGNVRMLVNGTTDVAPVSRGSVVTSSVRDWNGDGRPDRIFTFQTSALVAAGLHSGAGTSALILRDNISSQKWEARDPAPPAIVP